MKSKDIIEFFKQIPYVEFKCEQKNVMMRTVNGNVIKLAERDIVELQITALGILIVVKWGLIMVLEDGAVDIRTINSTKNSLKRDDKMRKEKGGIKK